MRYSLVPLSAPVCPVHMSRVGHTCDGDRVVCYHDSEDTNLDISSMSSMGLSFLGLQYDTLFHFLATCMLIPNKIPRNLSTQELQSWVADRCHLALARWLSHREHATLVGNYFKFKEHVDSFKYLESHSKYINLDADTYWAERYRPEHTWKVDRLCEALPHQRTVAAEFHRQDDRVPCTIHVQVLVCTRHAAIGATCNRAHRKFCFDAR